MYNYPFTQEFYLIQIFKLVWGWELKEMIRNYHRNIIHTWPSIWVWMVYLSFDVLWMVRGHHKVGLIHIILPTSDWKLFYIWILTIKRWQMEAFQSQTTGSFSLHAGNLFLPHLHKTWAALVLFQCFPSVDVKISYLGQR